MNGNIGVMLGGLFLVVIFLGKNLMREVRTADEMERGPHAGQLHEEEIK